MASWTYSFALSPDKVRADTCLVHVMMLSLQCRFMAGLCIHQLSSIRFPSPFWQVHSWWETQSTVRLVDAKCIFFSITWAFSGTPYSFGVNVSLFLFWWVQWQVTEFERLVRQRSAGSLEAVALKQTIAWKGRKLVFQTRLDKTQIMQPKGLHW